MLIQWSAIDSKFVLKRVGEDPSWRARLGTNMITKVVLYLLVYYHIDQSVFTYLLLDFF